MTAISEVPASLDATPDPASLDPASPVPDDVSGIDETEEPGHRAQRTAELFDRLALTEDDFSRRRLRQQIVELNMPLARSVARRYRDRGIGLDDLHQVAYVGLLKAVNGFDPTVASDFHSYAVPTMRGEVRRHFRDFGWTVRPPRRLQELQQRIRSAAQELQQSLGRSPRPSEIAQHLDADVLDVVEALACTGAFTPASLDVPTGEDGTSTVADRLGGLDDDLRLLENRIALAPAVRRLSARDRRIIQLRYFEDWTQQRIGEELGVSQVQVSRILARIMRDLRGELTSG